MGVLLHLLTCFVCIQAILAHPLQEDVGGLLYDDVNRLHVVKKDAYYPFKESLLSTLGLLENSREGIQNQRKKAVDSTFIRFGRSSSAESKLLHEAPQPIMFDPSIFSANHGSQSSSSKVGQRMILNHNGCQINNSRELVRALMNDRDCIKTSPKAKRENVNDTFIRFGKRSLPSGEQFETRNSDEQ